MARSTANLDISTKPPQGYIFMSRPQPMASIMGVSVGPNFFEVAHMGTFPTDIAYWVGTVRFRLKREVASVIRGMAPAERSGSGAQGPTDAPGLRKVSVMSQYLLIRQAERACG